MEAATVTQVGLRRRLSLPLEHVRHRRCVSGLRQGVDATQCLSCHNRYPPVDWYHADGEHPLATHDLIDLVSGVPVVESVA